MTLLQAFFQEYLVTQRGLSKNTVMAYRDALKLFFACQSSQQNRPVARLSLEDINAESVLFFLDRLEQERNNSVLTRNLRLAAIKTFSLFLTTRDLQRAGEYQRIIALPLKKVPHKVIDYLEIDEINAIEDAIDLDQRGGQRDYTLLKLLYNTGARVQEICDLTVSSVTFGRLPSVALVGKGNKTRHVPIWSETAASVKRHLQNNQLLNSPPAKIFSNAKGQPLGRFGIRYIIKKWALIAADGCPSLTEKTIGPHTYRHSLAMHLLQSGIDLSIIKSWLGHINLATTHAYVEIDMQMKRKVLDAHSPGNSRSMKRLLDKNQDILTWLESI